MRWIGRGVLGVEGGSRGLMSVQGRSRLDVPALPDAATSTAADLVLDLQENIPHPTLNLQIFHFEGILKVFMGSLGGGCSASSH